MSAKYIFITGGVVSGLGKGITAASLGCLLSARGLRVTMQKMDPYLNVDPGTMSPYQHGEVFVTDDGAETDLDLGHYERFTNENLKSGSSVTAGKVYSSVLGRERNGDYRGGTIQVIPHITNDIKDRVYRLGKSGADVVITEIGGTVGDIELQCFLEAIRQVSLEVGKENVVYVHVSLIVSVGEELKSKPTQHSVKELLRLGIQPDIIVCRAERPLTRDVREKIALFCNVEQNCVIQNVTASSVYEVPLLLEKEGFDTVLLRKLRLETPPANMETWQFLVDKEKNATKTVTIALVGKYTALRDAYLSVAESLSHAGVSHDAKIDLRWVDSEALTEKNLDEQLSGSQGILVPGGFGDRGIDGKILAARYARVNGVPYLGICLGMQMAVVEFARAVCGLTGAHSADIAPETEHPVFIIPEQQDETQKGGTMRLGLYPCRVASGTLLHDVYGEEIIYERHRHRFEFANEYRDIMSQNGLILSGFSPDGSLVEAIELAGHPFFVGVQYHPEFKSRLQHPHPVIARFVGQALALRPQGKA